MAARILALVLSISQLTLDQAWMLIVLIASEFLLAYFGRQVWLRCD